MARVDELPEAIASQIRACGTDINKFYIEDGREVDICMQVTNHDDQSLDALRYITFPSEYGRDVSLEAALSDRHDF